MKKFFLMGVLLFFAATIFAQEETKSFIGTFKSVSENNEFTFTDESGNTLVFNELDENVEIDLYEEGMIGKKFKVSWMERADDVYNEEGEETGKKQTVNVIVSLEMQ